LNLNLMDAYIALQFASATRFICQFSLVLLYVKAVTHPSLTVLAASGGQREPWCYSDIA
jgi:hypothetical protein